MGKSRHRNTTRKQRNKQVKSVHSEFTDTTHTDTHPSNHTHSNPSKDESTSHLSTHTLSIASNSCISSNNDYDNGSHQQQDGPIEETNQTTHTDICYIESHANISKNDNGVHVEEYQTSEISTIVSVDMTNGLKESNSVTCDTPHNENSHQHTVHFEGIVETEEPCPSTEEPCPSTEEPCPSTEEPCPSTEEPCPPTEEPCPSAVPEEHDSLLHSTHSTDDGDSRCALTPMNTPMHTDTDASVVDGEGAPDSSDTSTTKALSVDELSPSHVNVSSPSRPPVAPTPRAPFSRHRVFSYRFIALAVARVVRLGERAVEHVQEEVEKFAGVHGYTSSDKNYSMGVVELYSLPDKVEEGEKSEEVIDPDDVLVVSDTAVLRIVLTACAAFALAVCRLMMAIYRAGVVVVARKAYRSTMRLAARCMSLAVWVVLLPIYVPLYVAKAILYTIFPIARTTEPKVAALSKRI
mmetsp:Transcript_8814/g.13191  ORF Transcript_8814/g.13191 Transcript_8814/m.13191 type:complete len:464 (+) Transcript_8814:70-1461(+)